MRYQTGKCNNKDCRFEHACGYPKSDGTVCGGPHPSMDQQVSPVSGAAHQIELPAPLSNAMDMDDKSPQLDSMCMDLDMVPTSPKETTTPQGADTQNEAVEHPSPQPMPAHFAPLSQAIFAPSTPDITPSAMLSEMEQDQVYTQQPLKNHTIGLDIPPSSSNPCQDILTPWSCKGTKIFVDICSGVSKPLSTAIEPLGLPALPIDIFLDSRMDILNDQFFEQLLRLCGSGIVGYTGASPACTEYSLLKLRPGGPKALRTPEQLQGVPNLTESEQLRLQESATMLDRCIQAISCTYTAGGHGHLEQPSGAMSWRESSTKQWLSQANCALIMLAACAYGWDIT